MKIFLSVSLLVFVFLAGCGKKTSKDEDDFKEDRTSFQPMDRFNIIYEEAWSDMDIMIICDLWTNEEYLMVKCDEGVGVGAMPTHPFFAIPHESLSFVEIENRLDVYELANNFVNFLLKEEYSKAVGMFDNDLKSLMSIERLSGIWRKVVKVAGPYKKQIGFRYTLEAIDAVYVTCQFSKTVMDIRIQFNEDNKIMSLHFIPK